MHSLILALLLVLTGCSSLFPPANTKTAKPDDTVPTPAAVEASTPPKRRILLLPFLNRTPYQEEQLTPAVQEAIRRTVGSSSQVVFVPDTEFGDKLPKIGESTEYDLTAVFRLARNHGIAGVLGGSIEDVSVSEGGDDVGLFRSKQYAVRATVQMRLYDTRSEIEIFDKTDSAEVTEELTTLFGSRAPSAADPERVKGAVGKASEKLAAELPPYLKRVEWVGRIAKIELHRLYINAGELSGIRMGQLLKVYGEGTAVRDDSSNTFLGIAPGPFKGILKVVDYFGNDGAVAVVHSGAGFRERDRVEVLSSPKN